MNSRRNTFSLLCALLGLTLLFFGPGPAGAAGGAKKDEGGGDHGGGEDAGGDHGPTEGKDDGPPEFDGPPPPLPWEIPRADENRCTTEEIVVLRELRERSEQLMLRAAALDERERAIEEAEHLLATRMAKIESMRADIIGKLEDERSSIMTSIREEQDSRLKAIEAEQAVVLEAIAKDQRVKEERVVELAGIVNTMKPKKAAQMLAGMDENIVLQILLQLRAKSAGKILEQMPADVAQRLGDRMTVSRDPRRAASKGAKNAQSSGNDKLAAPPSLPKAPAEGDTTSPGDGLAAPAGAPTPAAPESK